MKWNGIENRNQAEINRKLTNPIPAGNGIRQGDSLSLLLFNIIMDEIIKKVSKLRGYKVGEKKINLLCYADDAVWVAEHEDDLQRLLHQFNLVAKSFNILNQNALRHQRHC